MGSRILAAIENYKTRPCMGVRDMSCSNVNHYANSYSWHTFETIGKRVKRFSRGLQRLLKPYEHVGICAGNRPEWVIADFACILQRFISVPIYPQLNERDMVFTINNTNISLVVCDKKTLAGFIGLRSQCPSLRHIVFMDSITETIPSTGDDDSVIHCMENIEKDESTNESDYVIDDDDKCLTVVYTSGSSGFPKGAMLSKLAFTALFPTSPSSMNSERITFCYRPLAWITDRKATIATFLTGGCVGFSTGDVARLMEELALIAPTSFSAPPTIWNKIYSEFKTALSLLAEYDEERLLDQFSKLIPTRCRTISIGGAMVSSRVFNFMRRCFRHCRIVEAYGTTECGRITFNDHFLSTMVDYRLESIPEMSYTLDDMPLPRGELLVKTTQMFSGYVNNPEETKAAFTDDGFFRTGDIVELRLRDDGKPGIHVIDRKKSFFKLSHGQFVSPEVLEGIYIQSLFIEHIFICGDGFQDHVTAVVVPNTTYVKAFATQHNLHELQFNNSDKTLVHYIMKDLRAIASKESLRPHEIPSQLIID